MTGTTPLDGGDPPRRHAADPAEGADPDDQGTAREPQEHPEDPAEG